MIDYIDFTMLTIAASAFFLSFSQSRSTIKHNKLSVKPLLHFTVNVHTSEDFSLGLINAGLGPAIIENISMTYKNKKYFIDNSSGYTECFNALGLDLSEGGANRVNTMDEGYTISVGEEVTLILFENTQENSEILEFMRDNFFNISFIVNYKNIYGDGFLECSD